MPPSRNAPLRDVAQTSRGAKLERRAIQLGLRGQKLERFADEWIVAIEDISGFVAEQRDCLRRDGVRKLVTPYEDVYDVQDKLVAAKLGLDQVGE